jgi:hypothetical protein
MLSCRMMARRFQGFAMLKEVGTSGQISLGKKYAGQLFAVELQADGCILLRPMKLVPTNGATSTPLASDSNSNPKLGPNL